jgi:hypothetical protein
MEMERLIDKMLSAEFERYATADLNRPLTDHLEVLEGVSSFCNFTFVEIIYIIYDLYRRNWYP